MTRIEYAMEAIQLLRDLENITEKLTRYVNGDTVKEAV